MDNKKTATNSTLAIGGVSSPIDIFVVVESSFLRTNTDSYRDAESPLIANAKRTLVCSVKPNDNKIVLQQKLYKNETKKFTYRHVSFCVVSKLRHRSQSYLD